MTADDRLKLACYMEICDSLVLKDSSLLFEAGQYGSALGYTHECAVYLKEASDLACTDDEKDIVSELKKYNELRRTEASAMEKVKEGRQVSDQFHVYTQKCVFSFFGCFASVYVCVCLFLCACMYVCMYVCMHACMY